jgi:periplasmic divalent cation tolerance protein
MSDAIQVVTTTSSKDEANAIARALVERRLAACVQVAGPIASTYRWQGQIESAQEFLCLIKTRRRYYQAVQDTIHELHSYDVPEVMAFEVVAGSRAYLDWIGGELTD